MTSKIKDNELFTVSKQWLLSVGVSEEDIVSVKNRYSKTVYHLTEYTIMEELSEVVRDICIEDEEVIPEDKVFVDFDVIEKIMSEINFDILHTSYNTDINLNKDIHYELKRSLAIKKSKTFENFRELAKLLEEALKGDEDGEDD